MFGEIKGSNKQIQETPRHCPQIVAGSSGRFDMATDTASVFLLLVVSSGDFTLP